MPDRDGESLIVATRAYRRAVGWDATPVEV